RNHIGYPIPRHIHIEGGIDNHALLLDRSACRLYELGGLAKQNGRWHAWAGATWSVRSNRVRPAGWTSADAAGLPIFPGLARFDEARRGVIDHAPRFTVQRTRRAYVYPARPFASSLTDPHLPALCPRLRYGTSERTGRKRSCPRSIAPPLRSPPTRLRLCASSSAGPIACRPRISSRKPGAKRSTCASIRSVMSSDEPFGTWQYAQAACLPSGTRDGSKRLVCASSTKGLPTGRPLQAPHSEAEISSNDPPRCTVPARAHSAARQGTGPSNAQSTLN